MFPQGAIRPERKQLLGDLAVAAMRSLRMFFQARARWIRQTGRADVNEHFFCRLLRWFQKSHRESRLLSTSRRGGKAVPERLARSRILLAELAELAVTYEAEFLRAFLSMREDELTAVETASIVAWKENYSMRRQQLSWRKSSTCGQRKDRHQKGSRPLVLLSAQLRSGREHWSECTIDDYALEAMPVTSTEPGLDDGGYEFQLRVKLEKYEAVPNKIERKPSRPRRTQKPRLEDALAKLRLRKREEQRLPSVTANASEVKGKIVVRLDRYTHDTPLDLPEDEQSWIPFTGERVPSGWHGPVDVLLDNDGQPFATLRHRRPSTLDEWLRECRKKAPGFPTWQLRVALLRHPGRRGPMQMRVGRV